MKLICLYLAAALSCLTLIACTPPLPTQESSVNAEKTATPFPYFGDDGGGAPQGSARLFAAYPSPDGSWRAEIIIHDCADVDGAMESHEQLKLIHTADGSETIVREQLVNCGGLGAYGFEGKGWTDDSRFFDFSDAREGVPDGLGDWQPPLYRLDRSDLSVAQLDEITESDAADLGMVAYVLDGDIWLKQIPDGEPQRITEDGENHTPVWSPTGKWLAFRKLESQVWVYSLAKNEAIAVESGAPINFFSWSPTEDRLALNVGSGMLHLRVWTASGPESNVLLAPDPNAQPHRMFWSPNGKRLAYEWSRFDPGSNKLFDEIRVLATDDGESHSLLSTDVMEQGSLQLGGWSGQGDQLLFWNGPRPIDSYLPETVDLMMLPADPVSSDGPSLCTSDASWPLIEDIATAPPDSLLGSVNAVAVTVGEGPSWTNKHIALADLPLTPAEQVAIQPDWRADGGQLAYSAMPEISVTNPSQGERILHQRRIWRIAVGNGTPPQQLTGDVAYRDERPQWSKDGQTIIFARLDADNNPSLWAIPAPGGQPDLILQRMSIINPYGHPLYDIPWHKSYDWHPGAGSTPFEE